MATRARVHRSLPIFRRGMQAITHMRKADLIQEIRSHGEVPHPQWTTVELRSRLREIRTMNLLNEENPLKGMRTMRRDQLVTLCENLNVGYATHDTRGTLMRRLRESQTMRQPAEPSDLMEFGKYKEMTYGTVLEQHDEYAVWCIETAEESSSADARLVRFANWAHKELYEKAKKGKGKSTGTKTVAPSKGKFKGSSSKSKTASSSGATEASWEFPMDEDDEPTVTDKKRALTSQPAIRPSTAPSGASAAASSTDVNQQLLDAMNQIMNRLTVLENRTRDANEESESQAETEAYNVPVKDPDLEEKEEGVP